MLCRAVRYFYASLAAISLLCSSQLAQASTTLVISQVYGGGGNTGAPYHNDYIEIFNLSKNTVSLAGYSVQYAATTGTNWQKTDLTGSLAPGQYFLIQEGAGTGGGAALPTPDVIGTIPMAQGAGKVVLVSNQTLITAGTSCPAGASIIDKVGFGSGTNCFEGSGPTPTISNTIAAFRAAAGCTDSDNNASDFSTAAPAPRNSATTLNPCSKDPTGVGAASPSSVFQGDATLLTVVVTPGTNPTSTGLAVTANLSAIGGSATQTFFDDGSNGDVTAGDNTFSYSATVDPGTAAGLKSLPASITDAELRSGSASIGLTVTLASSNPSGSGSAAPAILAAGGITLLSVAVTPGTGPTSTGIAVTVDLGLIGGSATQTFYDDGTHGDVTAGDNLFSFSATVDPGTTAGIKLLPATITDDQSRTGSASISLTVSAASGALRIVDYNILNYPGSTGTTRDPKYRTILGPLAADVIVVEEMNSQTGVNEFLGNVLNTLEPGQWSAAGFIDGNDTDGALFWKSSKVDFLGQWSFYPNPADQLRLVHVYRIRPADYSSEGAELRLYACHLKASDGSVERAQRLAEATGLRDSMNAMPPGTHAMVVGDMNFYRASDELAYAKLQEAQAIDIGRLYDPLGAADWHNNPDPAVTVIHTQSPCGASGGCIGGASSGGMDDRFDFFLPTLNLGDSQGLDIIPGSYVSVGNDGQHFNLGIADAPTIPEGASYASALVGASDHLPIRIDLQRPAKLTASTQTLNFPTVITGAPSPQLDLTVGNPATPPAAALHYSFSAAADYVVPSGNYSLGAAAPNASHAFFENTANVGNLTGASTLTSDAPDAPSTPIALSGTVLRHAVSSLDSTTVVATGSIDFGQNPIGAFTDQSVRLFDQGYDALQARLSLYSADIAGGDGRFSITGGFTPALIGGIGQTYNVHFDDTGATQDATYTGTLTFHTKDELLSGGLPQTDLVVSLQASILGATGVGDVSLPTRTRLLSPSPNPLAGSTLLRFELAHAANVHLDVLDLSGRRVATITSGAMQPGRYSYRWNGRTSGSAPAAGLYFVRLTGTGIPAQTARLAVLR